MFKEFKEFAMKGNVVDLAVAVIIGAAFGRIVTSLVEDIIMPIIGKVTGGLDFSNLYLPLSDKVAAGTSPPPLLPLLPLLPVLSSGLGGGLVDSPPCGGSG